MLFPYRTPELVTKLVLREVLEFSTHPSRQLPKTWSYRHPERPPLRSPRQPTKLAPSFWDMEVTVLYKNINACRFIMEHGQLFRKETTQELNPEHKQAEAVVKNLKVLGFLPFVIRSKSKKKAARARQSLRAHSPVHSKRNRPLVGKRVAVQPHPKTEASRG